MKNNTNDLFRSMNFFKRINYSLRIYFVFFYFTETKRRCGFFLEVFSLSLPDYLECDLFPENDNPDVCVGHFEVIETNARAMKPGKCYDKSNKLDRRSKEDNRFDQTIKIV